MTGIIIKWPCKGTETQGKSPMKMEAETGMIHLEAKECQGLLAIPRAKSGME